MDSGLAVGLLGLLPVLLLSAIAIRDRLKRRKGPRYVLVAVGPRAKWSTRPPLVRDREALTQLQDIGAVIERAGLGTPQRMTFLGEPSMDLLVEAADPVAAAHQLRATLEGRPVSVSVVGRQGDLRWVAHLWRHM
jgi:hypothetical protein